MSSRKTVYLSDKSEKIIGPAESLSGRINMLIAHYARMTSAGAPTLTIKEWSMICDILNSTVIEENTGDHLWADISESGRLDGMADKWEIDTEALAVKVRDMSHAARCKILDVVLFFWKSDIHKNPDMAAALTAAGAKISDAPGA